MKFKKIKSFLAVFFVLSIVGIYSVSRAEMQIETQEGDIIVDVTPNNPQPYNNVTIKVSSYATDLNKATITWQGDSGVVLSGIGKTSYSFKATGPNTSMIFIIKIKPSDSMATITKKIIISPSEIELLWEAIDGYTPPFYKGKALPSRGGLIKAVAIPNTDTIKSGSGNISYTWKNNEEAVPDASGYNKDSYTFKNDLFESKNEITVTASSVSESYNAEKNMDISSYSPKVLFYKRSPTEGILYNNALSTSSVFSEDEMTVVAEPYFLAIKGSEGAFNYTWKINGDAIKTPSKKTELTIRPTSRGGYANISITLESINKLFQKITGTLKLSL